MRGGGGRRAAAMAPLLVAACLAHGGDAPDGPVLGDGTGSTEAPGDASDPSAPTPPTTGGTTSLPETPPSEATTAADSSGDTTGPACDSPQTWYRDQDGDGYGDAGETTDACVAPAGFVADATDCDDADAEVHPGAAEPCGGPDVDCDAAEPALCRSCLDALTTAAGTEDGLYTIDPDGEAGALPQQQVYCDMTTDGGGWTLVQRTVWDSSQTDAMRTGYASWLGTTVGTAAPGFGFRLSGETWPALNEELDHLLRLEIRLAADGESCEPLFYVGTDGAVAVDATAASITGLAADVAMFSDVQLSTLDSGPSSTCLSSNAIPWFYGACCSTCPAYQGPYWTARRPMVSYSGVADLGGNTAAEVCPDAPQGALNGSSFVGLNVMEYYLR